MNFKAWLQAESEGLYGNIRSANGTLDLIDKQLKDCQPVKGKGSSVARMISSGPKPTTPARPMGLVSPKKPMTVASVLK